MKFSACFVIEDACRQEGIWVSIPLKDLPGSCGVRTYEPRQGRNAATAVCFVSAASSPGFLFDYLNREKEMKSK